MIRWRFVLVRLLIVVAILVIMRWTASPLAQYLVIRALETSTGAKVEIASTDIGLFPPRIHFAGLKLADPRKEMRNLFEAEHVYLAINGDLLLKRRYEVSSGRLSGIRIGGQRTESGFLEVVPEEPTTEPTGPSYLQKWCDTLSTDMQQKTEEFGENLATVQEAKRIREYWENEYTSLRQRAKLLETNIRALRATVKSIDNPLRDLPALQESLRQADAIRNELAGVRQKLDSMPGLVKGDLKSIDEARRADQARVASYLPEGFDGSPASIGPELLGELIKDHLQTVRDYVESGRSIAQVTVAAPKAERCRGVNIELGEPEGPAWRVARCEVDGLFTVNKEVYNVVGIVENITSDTERMKGPLHARLNLDGPRVVRVDFQRSFATAVPTDHLRIHWPELDLPAKRLGNSKDAALVVDGGKLNLWVDIEACGDAIQGRLVSRQSNTQLHLTTKPSIERIVVVQSLQRSLAEIHTVDVDASFRGNWRRMDLDVNTNLSSCIANSVQTALTEQIAATREKLARKVEQEYEKQMVEIQDWIGKQQLGARELLAQTDQVIDEMNRKVAAEMGSADAYLGKVRSGLGKVFK